MSASFRPLALGLFSQIAATRAPLNTVRSVATCRRFSSTDPIRAVKRQRTATATDGVQSTQVSDPSSALSATPSTTKSKSAPAPSSTTSQTPPRSPLPYLPRPLGVPEPPNTKSKTWQEKKEELLDKERHIAKRKALSVKLLASVHEDNSRSRLL
jgi:ATPase complex subunit ATP10